MVARADGRSGVVLAGPPPRRAFWPIAVLVALGALSWSVQSIVFERQTWLADDDLATRDWLRAGSYYRAALGWAPPWKAASAWSNLGHCLLAAPEHQPQQVAAAVEAYAHSVRLAPTDPYGWANQARALTALQHWKEGVQSWAQAIALDPFNPGFRFEAALLLYQGGALQPALDQVNAALSIYPDTASATNPLAADAARLRAQILRR
jgi:tetratricopeptide (TPR) repeat protein